MIRTHDRSYSQLLATYIYATQQHIEQTVCGSICMEIFTYIQLYYRQFFKLLHEVTPFCFPCVFQFVIPSILYRMYIIYILYIYVYRENTYIIIHIKLTCFTLSNNISLKRVSLKHCSLEPYM